MRYFLIFLFVSFAALPVFADEKPAETQNAEAEKSASSPDDVIVDSDLFNSEAFAREVVRFEGRVKEYRKEFNQLVLREVAEKRNACMINYGLGVNKFTGARGKSGTSDASAEVVAYIRRIFAENNVVWQLGELGKVDQGGGGTIAQYMANRNIDTIDAGVPVLSMHAPFEVVSKFDCYMAYKGMLAAYRDN